MRIKAFAIFDVKAKSYGQPFFAPHNGVALRMFSDLVEDKNSSVSRHAEDYKLYLVGEWDDQEGIFICLEIPEFLANAVDFIK